MIGVVGDLLEDVVAALGWPPGVTMVSSLLQSGADTPATVTRRPGGSAANVARTAARLGTAARFLGRVGDDPTGDRLVADLEAVGVEVLAQRGGTTGTVIVLLHPDGERSMVTDRGVAPLLTDPRPHWLDGLQLLHVPLYSLQTDPLAATTRTLARWAAERRVPVTVDLSSTTLLRQLGAGVGPTLRALAPTVVVANEAEAEVARHELALDLTRVAGRATVVKRGPASALLLAGAERREIPSIDLGPVSDTTGAGDAFAAGLLAALAADVGLDRAVVEGHRAAARRLAPPSDSSGRGGVVGR